MAEIASAFVSVVPSARGFGSKLNSEIGGDLDSSGKSAGKRMGTALKAGLIGAAAGAGIAAFKFLGGALAEARDAQVIGARTENVIKKMGNAANVSAKQVGDLAAAISNKTGIDDEAIQAGQNLLLTFGNIRNEAGKGNDIFNQTSQLMVDMSAAMGTDAKGSAIQLGKALNDPVKGLTALSRVGVSFTEQQKEQITALAESGKTMAAQKIILGELERQFGGAAAAMTSPAEKAKVAWGNLQEEVGTRLLPVVDKFLTFLVVKGIPAVSQFAGTMRTTLGPIIASVRAALTPLIALVGRFIARTGSSTGTFTKVGSTVRSVMGSVRSIFQSTVQIVTALWRRFGSNMVAFIGGSLRNMLTVVKGLFKILEGLFKTVAALLQGDWQGAWDGIKMIVEGAKGVIVGVVKQLWNLVRTAFTVGVKAAVSVVKGLPGKALAALGDLSRTLYNAGVQLMAGFAAGIRDKIGEAIDQVQAGLSKIKGLLPGSPIKWGPLKNWNNGGAGKRLMALVAKGIKDATPKTVKAAQDAFAKIGDKLTAARDSLKSTLEGLKSDFESLADSVSNAFAGNLFDISATEADPAAGIAARSVGQNFIDNLMGKKAELTSLLSSFTTLKGWGLDPAFLSQLFASGNGALITELAGMGPAGATSAASLFGEVTSLGDQLGANVAANDPVASRIEETNAELRKANRQLAFLADDIGKALDGAAASAQRDKKKRGKK